MDIGSSPIRLRPINRAVIRFLCVIADQLIALFTVLGFYRIKKKPSLECTRMFNPYIILNTQWIVYSKLDTNYIFQSFYLKALNSLINLCTI